MEKFVKKPDDDIQQSVNRMVPLPANKIIKEQIFDQPMARVKGRIFEFNYELFNTLPINNKTLDKILAVFVDWSRKYAGTEDASVDMQGMLEHGRSVFFNVVFADKLKNTYSYIDIKGVGMPQKVLFAHKETIEKCGVVIWGAVDLKSALEDMRKSNILVKNGINTSAPIAIIIIDEVIMADGKKLKVEELKDIFKDFQPVLYLRAFSELIRVDEAMPEDFEKFATGRGMKVGRYARWWAESEAINVAKLHNLGLSHRHLIGQNLTLDGGFTDNRKITKSSKPNNWQDISNVLKSVCNMSENLSLNSVENQKLFLKKYLETRKEITKDELRFVYSSFVLYSAESQSYNELAKLIEKRI